jgi:hypothetical protein
MPRQYPQHRRADHVTHRRRVATRIDERAVSYQRVKPSTQLQVFDKKSKMAERCYRSIRIPLNPHRTSVSIDHQRAVRSPFHNAR